MISIHAFFLYTRELAFTHFINQADIRPVAAMCQCLMWGVEFQARQKTYTFP